jgi:undecaprenyl diphosphate synthase
MTKELSVGIIMDGNRRWAREKGVSTKDGQVEGYTTLMTLLRDYARLRDEYGIHHYIFYALSSENWNRAEEEVAGLLSLLRRALSEIEDEIARIDEAPAIRFIGDMSRFEESIQTRMKEIEERTKDNKGTVALALSYGGRDEIVRAAQNTKDFSEEGIGKALDTAGIPDPDIIIRTGGEKRLSNFLLWQAAYSELFFINIYWPDFTSDTLIDCVKEYNVRERRHGI